MQNGKNCQGKGFEWRLKGPGRGTKDPPVSLCLHLYLPSILKHACALVIALGSQSDLCMKGW